MQNTIIGVLMIYLITMAWRWIRYLLIREATNFEPNKTPSCIDLIFTSQSNLVSDSGVHPSQYATCHHQIIFAKIDLEVHLLYLQKRSLDLQ